MVVRSDRGAAVVWSLALVSILGLVALVGGAVGGVVTARQHVAAAADLAALAAAQAPDDPCGHAGAVAQANDVTIDGCRVVGTDVVVEVHGEPPPIVSRLLSFLGAGATPTIRVSARAGPPDG